jgi:rubrerythrin
LSPTIRVNPAKLRAKITESGRVSASIEGLEDEMAQHFTAHEILTMAERIEQNGASFYRRAAEIAAAPEARARLLELAEMEDGHERLFAALRADLSSASLTHDPDGVADAYLQVMADQHIFRQVDARELLRGDESVEEILGMALRFERDSILFFDGLLPFVPAGAGRDRVLALIEEERRHVAMLARERSRHV